MDKKALIATAASTFIAVVVTGLVGWFTGVWSQGSEAMARDQIEAIAKEVIADEMTTDSGITQAQALVQISQALVRIETKVEGVEDDVADIRQAVRALAQ
jgi:type II secretory pathway predicted ATPase ExeA